MLHTPGISAGFSWSHAPLEGAGLGSPGDPFYVVRINGVKIHETEEVDRGPQTTTTVPMSAKALQQFDAGTLNVSVTLLDGDLSSDDAIATWSIAVPYEPEQTPTPSSTSMPTPTSTVSQTATTPTATSTVPETATATSSPTASATPAPDKPGVLVTIVEVVDGDTVKIKYENGTRDTARLLGVDTPEVYSENTPEEFEGVPNTEAGAQCLGRWGDEASQFTNQQLLGEQVRITFDENEPRRGYYDRLLVYIHLDGTLFNDNLVRKGYARVYTDSSFTRKSPFLEYEEQVQSSGTGLWECQEVSTPSPTETPTQGDGTVVIHQIHEDAQGDEYDNLDDEYVVLKNTGDSPADIGGWTLKDDDGHEYMIPAGFTLGAGETVTIRTGRGSDTESDLYMDRGAPVWNNGGDVVNLQDGSGNVVDRREY